MLEMLIRGRRALAATFAVVAVLCVGPAWADDFDVTVFTDNPADGLTLRQAIIQANTHEGPDTIHLHRGTYRLEITGIDEDLAATGDLDVRDPEGLTILGVIDDGQPASIIDAETCGDRVLDVRPNAKLVAEGVVVRGGGRNPEVNFAGGVFVDVLATLTLTNCVVRENGGPGIAGPGIRNDGTLNMSFCTVTQNTAPDECCGGIDSRGSTTVSQSVISDNEAGGCEGGGICAYDGFLSIYNSSITGNTALFTGGGIAAFDTNVNIVDSTIADNSVQGDGGGLYFDGSGLFSSGTLHLNIETSTISGNHASGGSTFGTTSAHGGGLYVNDGDATIRNTTIVSNEAQSGAGVFFDNSEESTDDFAAFNSLIGNNDGDDCVTNFSVLRLDGRNFIEDTAQCVLTGNNTVSQGLLSGMDPHLGPLQDNGGDVNHRTKTHLPLPGSPVIDQGSCRGDGSLAPEGGYWDQRNFSRNLIFVPTTRERREGDGCDLGAAEYRKEDLDALGGVQVPIRWCVLRGTSATEPDGDGANEIALERLSSANAILTSQSDTTLYLRSAASALVADVQIIDYHNADGDVSVGPSATSPDLSEFLALINECRARWSDLPGGLTAVLIHRFVDDSGSVVPIAGIGGRAIEGDCASQLSTGRVMIIDRGPLDDLDCDLEMTTERLAKFLSHELGHAFSLRHGDAIDSNGDHIIDEPPDTPPDMAGDNLMEYGPLTGAPGTRLKGDQTFQAKEHALECVPGAEPLGLQPLTADLKTAFDDDPADPGRIKILSYGIVLNLNATSTLFAETVNSPVTGNLANETFRVLAPPSGTTTYKFLGDLDHNPETGGTDPDDPSFRGLELIGVVEVGVGGTITPTVKTFLDGNWVSQEGATADVKELNIGIAQLCGNFTDLDPLVGASVQLAIPDHVLTEAHWDYGKQLDVQIFASETETGQHNTVPPDARIPLLANLEAQLLPSCAVSPSSVAPEADATISATGYIGNTQLDVKLGSATLGTISAAAPGGNGTLHAPIPFGTPAGRTLIEVRDPQSALQSFCAVDVADEPLRARCHDVTLSTDAGKCSAATASIDAGSGDPNGGNVTIVQTPAGPYPLGATTVNLTVSDSAGHSASCTGVVRVVDAEGPAISVSVSPQRIWPPNHRMVDVTATVRIRDNCVAVAPTFVLTSITSNEPNGRSGDIQGAAYGTPDTRFQLRAERNGDGSGRVYKIVYTTTDRAGNAESGEARVEVPHDRGRF